MNKIEKLQGIITRIYQGELKNEIFNENLDLIEMLGFDSLQMVMLIVEIEEEFGININQEELDPYILCKFKKLTEIVGV